MSRYASIFLPLFSLFALACDDLIDQIEDEANTADPACECDAAITKTAGSDFEAGGTGVFVLNVSYHGHPDCEDGRLCVSDSLPAGMSYVGGGLMSGDWDCSASGQEVSCCLDETLATSLTDYTVTLEVEIDPSLAGETIENCAEIDLDVKSAFNDADPGNNSSCVEVEIEGGLADLSVEKTAVSEFFAAGQTGIWQIAVTNDGPADASGVVITDTLPDGMYFDNSPSAGWSCTGDGLQPETVTCVLGAPLAAGATEVLEIEVFVEFLEEGENCASVDADTLDPNGENNDSCAEIALPSEICDGLDDDGDGLIDEGFDLDGDGVARCCEPEGDFFATRGPASQTMDLWYYEPAAGTFAATPVEAADFGAGYSLMGVYDADADGALDVLTWRDNSTWMTTCDEEWQTIELEPSEVGYFGGADLDFDGENDLVGWDLSGGVGYTGLGLGGGMLGLSWGAYDMSAFTSAYTMGRIYNLEDLNGDGREDMVVWDYDHGGSASTDFFWMAGNGDGTFGGLQTLFTLGSQPQNYGDMGDINGDGCADVIGGGDDDNDSGAVYALYGTCGAEPLITSSAVIADPCGNGACTGDGWGPGYGMSQLHDWDGDGDLDLLASHFVNSDTFYTARVWFYTNDGSGNFSQVGAVVDTIDLSSYTFVSPMNW